MKELFLNRAKNYFKDDFENYLEALNQPLSQAFFLNTNKASQEDIFKIIDFPYEKSELTSFSFYHHLDNIGKTKAYELGLIYPQEIASSISSTLIDTKNIKTIVDLASAPGGKTINCLNKLSKDVLCICNDCNHSRALILSSNLERLGLDNVIITNKTCEILSKELENFADLLILDAPCSGEGMLRKYPEILDDYKLENINALKNIQEGLLENAYQILKKDGQLLYSTCTYAFEEDEQQIINFLNKHPDMELIENDFKFKNISQLKGTIKLSPLNHTEGQFICLMRKKNDTLVNNNFKYLKPIKEKLIDDFILDNFNLDNYYLYKYRDNYYLSLLPLIDLHNNIIRYGINIGEIINKRFQPNHNLYRANSLIGKYKYVYDLNDEEYEKYIIGNELNVELENHYYLITYHQQSLGYGKCVDKRLKNKYPKGLRIKN